MFVAVVVVVLVPVVAFVLEAVIVMVVAGCGFVVALVS